MTSLWRADGAVVAGSPFQPGQHRDVLVVGAGITGLSTALQLVREGLDVAVVEAAEVGNLATGGNTGKLSLLQGKVLSTLRRHHSAALVRAYVDANRDGARWLTDFADEAGIAYTSRTRTPTRSRMPGFTTSMRSSPPHTKQDSPCAGNCPTRPAGSRSSTRSPSTTSIGHRSAGGDPRPGPCVPGCRRHAAHRDALGTSGLAAHRGRDDRRIRLSPSGGAGDRGPHHVSRLLLRQDPRTSVLLRRVRRAGRGARRPLPVRRRPHPVASLGDVRRRTRGVSPGWSSAATATRSAARSPNALSSMTSSTGRAGTSPVPSRSSPGRLRTTSRTI